MSSGREAILARIRAAGGPATAPSAPVAVQPALPDLPLAVFQSRAVDAEADVRLLDGPAAVPGAVADLVPQVRAIGVAPDGLPGPDDWAAAGLEARPGAREPVVALPAFAGIAETGTVVLLSTDAPTDLAFLADHLVVVLDRSDITAWQETVWERLHRRFGLEPPRGVILMTGPSRTADVEQTLQLGAHGPRRLTILVT